MKFKPESFGRFCCFVFLITFLLIQVIWQVKGEAAEGTIRVGISGSNTGLWSDQAVPSLHGAKLFAKEVNQAGGVNGRQIEIVSYDDGCDPAKGSAISRKMIDVDNIIAMISLTCSGATVAMMKLSEEAKVPHIVGVGMSPIITEPMKPYTFRVTGNFYHEIDRMLEVLKDNKVKRVGILKDSGLVGTESMKGLGPGLKAAKIEIVANEGVPVGAVEVTAQTLNLRKANPEMVIFYGYGAEAALFGKTMNQIGWKIPVIGNRGLAFPIFYKLGGKTVDGFAFCDNYMESKPQSIELAKKFLSEYGYQPENCFPALGYDSMGVLVQALKTSGAKEVSDRAKLYSALEQINRYESVTGGKKCYISFSPTKRDGPTGSPKDIVVLRKVEGGKFVDY